MPGEIPDDAAVIAHLFEDIDGWVGWFKDHDIMVIIMARDPWVQMRSRAKAADRSMAEGLERYASDYRGAFKAILRHDLAFTIVPYECLLWKGSADRILSLFGLKQTLPLIVQGKVAEIRDENGKWYANA